MTIGEIVNADGLTFEEHTVTTEDGYILNLHRIYSAEFGSIISLPVIFLQHGLMSSSELFILHGAPSDS